MKDLIENIARLRSNIHLFEKGLFLDDNTRIKRMKQLFELCKNELSISEIRWIEKVLYNRNYISNYKDSKDFQNVIVNRRSYRKFKGPISETDYHTCLHSALYAPSSCNRQGNEFILILDKNKLNKIYEIKKQKFLKDTPSIVIVLSDKRVYFQSKKRLEYFMLLDSGAAIQNFILTAFYLGYGTCWVNIDTKRESGLICDIFKIPDDYIVVSLIAIGTIKEKIIKSPGRKNIIKKVNKWD